MVSSSSSSFFFSCVCAETGSDLFFRLFRRARSEKCEASRGATDTRDGGGGGGGGRPPPPPPPPPPPTALHAPRACLSSPEKREKITSVIQAKLKPVIETSPSSRSSHFLGTSWYKVERSSRVVLARLRYLAP